MAERYSGDPSRERYGRGPIERAGDEVRSWFGDDEAARRRRLDEYNERNREVDWDRDRNAAERAWDRTKENVREATDRDRDGRRGLSEWNDNDRPRGFGDTSRYTTADPYAREWADRPYDRPYGGTTTDYRETSYPARDRNTPNYTGLGPRGYHRSDARMFEDICDRLTVDPRIDASDIEVKVENSEVTLSGSVRSREEKRYAEDIVERVMGIGEVNNHLKVQRADHVLGTARSGASMIGLTDTPPPPAEHKK